MPPLISVILPVYNGAKFLVEAINSILEQTFTDFEFIIINDGSTDDSENIILSYNDSRINYIKKNNTGISDTLVQGIQISKGKYIARMDADDIAFPTRFLKQVTFLEKNKEYILVASAVHYIDDGGKFVGRSIPYMSDSLIKYNLRFGSVIAHPSVMFLKEAYLKTHGYNKEIKGMFEDYLLWLEMSKYGKFYNFHSPLIAYRINNSSWYFKINQDELGAIMRKAYQLINENKYEDFMEVYKASIENLYRPGINSINTINSFTNIFKNCTKNNTVLTNHLYYFICQIKSVRSLIFQNLRAK